MARLLKSRHFRFRSEILAFGSMPRSNDHILLEHRLFDVQSYFSWPAWSYSPTNPCWHKTL